MSALDRQSLERTGVATAIVKVDVVFLGAVLALMAVGLCMVLSASGVMAEKFYGDSRHFFHRQLLFTALGLVVMALAAMAPARLVRESHYAGLVLAFGLLVLTLALGREAGGARRWLSLGPVSLQPMEFAKVALVCYLAWFFSRKRDKVKTFSVGVVPPFAVTGVLGLLVLLQPDFGGAAFLAMLLFFMSLVGGTRLVYLVLSLAAASGAAWLLIVSSPYRSRRLLAFLDPFKDAMDSGYQLVQSLYALGSGGLWGQGLGAGKQKLFFLPEAHNDFIMAVMGEELGFVGVSLVFVLVGVVLWRVFRTACLAEDLHQRYLAYGAGLVLGLGALLNMAVVLGSAPPKGVAMPFISYGGSSLFCSCLCAGLVLNVFRQVAVDGRR